MTGRSSSSQPSPDGPTIDADDDLERDRGEPDLRRQVHEDRREERDRRDDEDRAERDRRVLQLRHLRPEHRRGYGRRLARISSGARSGAVGAKAGATQ